MSAEFGGDRTLSRQYKTLMEEASELLRRGEIARSEEVRAEARMLRGGSALVGVGAVGYVPGGEKVVFSHRYMLTDFQVSSVRVRFRLAGGMNNLTFFQAASIVEGWSPDQVVDVTGRLGPIWAAKRARINTYYRQARGKLETVLGMLSTRGLFDYTIDCARHAFGDGTPNAEFWEEVVQVPVYYGRSLGWVEEFTRGVGPVDLGY